MTNPMQTEKGKVGRTPGPWRLVPQYDGFEIIGRPTWPCTRNGVPNEWTVATVAELSADEESAIGEGEANAEFIVRAVNSHDAMKAALEEIESAGFSMVNDSESLRHTIKSLQHIARTALSLTEQGEKR